MKIRKKKEIDKTLLEFYTQGLTYREMGKRIGMTAKQAQARIRTLKKQVKATEPSRSPDDLQKIRANIRTLRGQGLNMKTIGREIGITKPQVYRHLQAIGLE